VIKAALVVLGFVIAFSFAAPAAFATTTSATTSSSTTYSCPSGDLCYGPEFVLPTAIPPGSPITFSLTTVAANYFVTPPSGGGSPCSGTCAFPLQACAFSSTPDSTQFFYLIHEITVTDPQGNEFMLGSNSTSGLYWPSALGGSGSGTNVPPQAVPIDIMVGDNFNTMSLLQGSEGPSDNGFQFTSAIPLSSWPSLIVNPPAPYYSYNPEGSSSTLGYYWWIAVGNGAGQRLDKAGTNPTQLQGTYTVDIEGVVVCGNVDQQVTINLFFDAPIQVITPQFGLGVALAVALSMALVALMARKFRFKQTSLKL
jgi:hypothetical protein